MLWVHSLVSVHASTPTRAGLCIAAPYRSVARCKQVEALAALVDLAAGPAGGLIGSGWVVVLRALSALEALQASVPETSWPRASLADSQPAPERAPGSSASAGGSGAPGMSSDPRLNPGADQGTTAAVLDRGTSFGKFLSRLVVAAPPALDAPHAAGPGSGPGPGPGSGPAGAPAEAAHGSRPASARHSLIPNQALAHAGPPGAGLACWAGGPGQGAVEAIYARSAALGGEAVVVFTRALCAVSQEELDAPGAPRCGGPRA